eukprot:TRINITY_DN619_c0_g2_i1.p1 TRINITY_DN619_c0_g2~~TRINITY_DN619_c0_g2_i1.p1  ORF type:complete len:564 (-),score=89.29 TRINITY_DN619_c0_g2_i1:393-2084(-)
MRCFMVAWVVSRSSVLEGAAVGEQLPAPSHTRFVPQTPSPLDVLMENSSVTSMSPKAVLPPERLRQTTTVSQQSRSTVFGPVLSDEDLQNLTVFARKIVGGIAQGFLTEKGSVLSETEVFCFSNGAGTLAGGILDTTTRAAQTFRAMTAQIASPLPRTSRSAVDPVLAGVEFSQRIASLVDFAEKIAAHCLKRSARDELRAAGRHMSNLTYVGEQLVSNGVDILSEFALAFGHLDRKEYTMFGENIGFACRKVLLEKGRSTGTTAEISPKAIEAVAAGLVSSLFSPGSWMMISTNAITTWAPPPPVFMPTASPRTAVFGSSAIRPQATLMPWTVMPAMVMNVDLHRCISDNVELFQHAWGPIWKVMGGLVEDLESGRSLEDGGGVRGFGELAISMLDVQVAMSRCGLTSEQEMILWDGIRAGHRFNTEFHMGGDQATTTGDVATSFAKAVEAWGSQRWFSFGSSLGETLRKISTKLFSEKYSVDESGIRRKLRFHLPRINALSSVNMFAASGFAAFFAVVTLRWRRACLSWRQVLNPSDDLGSELQSPRALYESGRVIASDCP